MVSDYQRIETAINFIQRHVRTQPSLEETARHVGLSPYYFQRMFRRWAGVSPKRFLELLTVEHAKKCLDYAQTLLDTSFEVGLSGSARLHDHFVLIEAVTPGEYKTRGRGVEIAYGFHESPFGELFIAQTRRGVCRLSFPSQEERDRELIILENAWENAKIYEDIKGTAHTVRHMFPLSTASNRHLLLFVCGTNFQINVWRALMRIPEGYIMSYQQLAAYLECPRATRAVASAVAANPIGYLIPCHRVIKNSGAIGRYRWGSTRKKMMLVWESGRASTRSDEFEPR